MADGFTAIRNGLDDHFEEGKFTPYDMGVYYVILRQCDWKTGIWKGSAAKIVAAYGFSADLRDVQRSMQRLREIQMINYRTGRAQNRGKRGNYPVLLHHYKPQKGAYSGMRLNAFAPGSLENPAYEPCVVSDVLSDVVSASIQDIRIKITDENRGNTKASLRDASASSNSSNLSPIKKNGRPVLAASTVQSIKNLAQKLGLPSPDARDYCIAAQFLAKVGDEANDILDSFLNYREPESFKTIGQLFAATTGYSEYLKDRLFQDIDDSYTLNRPLTNGADPNCARCAGSGLRGSYSIPGKLVECECRNRLPLHAEPDNQPPRKPARGNGAAA